MIDSTASREGRRATPATGHDCRPATAADLATCGAIWREALNDYLGRLAQPEIPDDLGPILRLYGHLLATDPATFVVAERTDARGDRPGAIDGFAVAVRRDGLWFLSMLFVRPRAQAGGLGRMLIDAVSPSDSGGAGPGNGSGGAVTARATATDSVQPISNGLYGSLGMVPRLPLLRLVGLPSRDGAFPPLPDGVEAIAFDEVDGRGGADDPRTIDRDAADGLGRSALAAELATLDLDAVGFSRAVDHAYQLSEGRIGFLYRGPDGTPAGYGYTSEAGRVGPIAVREPELLGAVVGHLVRAVRPRGAFGIWVPGAAGSAIVPLLRSGFRFDGFPVLLCWDRPFADFARYIPLSPGLL